MKILNPPKRSSARIARLLITGCFTLTARSADVQGKGSRIGPQSVPKGPGGDRGSRADWSRSKACKISRSENCALGRHKRLQRSEFRVRRKWVSHRNQSRVG